MNGEGNQPGANQPFLCFVIEGDYMTWSKLNQQLEGFLSPALNGRVEYRLPLFT